MSRRSRLLWGWDTRDGEVRERTKGRIEREGPRAGDGYIDLDVLIEIRQQSRRSSVNGGFFNSRGSSRSILEASKPGAIEGLLMFRKIHP